MSDKHAKGIVDAVEQSEVYAKALQAVDDKEKPSVKATVEGFAKVLSPMIEALEQLELDEEAAAAVRKRLAEKLGAG